MLIDWKDSAKTDARAILEYIAQDNYAAALSVYAAIQEQVILLGDFPELGRTGRARGTRELIITRTPYIVVYRIKDDRVQILRVLHGAQKWPRRL